MQERHHDRRRYFEELAETSARHFIPYIERWHGVKPGMRVLEVGCGEGGNLLPFARMGCDVTGVDLAPGRIEEARRFFAEKRAKGRFIARDFLNLGSERRKYDIVVCHDVLEHIGDKRAMLSRIGSLLRADGVVFMAFPAWPMPFGGHQQICRSRLLSHVPFLHLLPAALYRVVLAGESEATWSELMSIRQTRITIEAFEKLTRLTGLAIADRTLYLINPHYEVKFGLTPRRLLWPLSSVPYVRNLLSSSCFYILRKGA